MTQSPFDAEVARAYQTALVPLIFEPYAEDLARTAQALAPQQVLEIACGTGVVTRALASALPSSCTLVASDLSTSMLSFAQEVGTARPVTWQQADAMSLPFAEDGFDLVVCQFGVMFFPDRVAAYREVRRVLRPGGAFLFNLWNDLGGNGFAAHVSDALDAHFPKDPPAFLARTPHAHGFPAEIEAELRAAGFGGCRWKQLDESSVAKNPEHAAVAYCHGTPLRGEILVRDPLGLDRATAAVAACLRANYGDGPFAEKMSAIVVHAD